MKKFLLCYDISGHRERQQIEKLASRSGMRVQKSVFWIAPETNRSLSELRGALRQLNIQTGTVLLIPIHTWQEVDSWGISLPDSPASEAWTVL